MMLNGIVPLTFAGVANARTYENTLTSTGAKLRARLLLRSARWDTASTDDFTWLKANGFTTMIDLRLPQEAAELPDLQRPFLTHVDAPLAADAISAQLLPISAYITHMQQHHDGYDQMVNGYVQMVAKPAYQVSVAAALTTALTADGGVVFHCSRGKDRTGIIAALLLDLLHVSRDIIYVDYLYSNIENAGHFLQQAAHFEALGADAAVKTQLLAMAQTNANYLAAAFDWIEFNYGNTERYAVAGLGISRDIIAAGRARLLA